MNQSISEFKEEFDNIFINELKRLLNNSENYTKLHPVKDYIEYIVTIASSGKRVRPYNTALTYTIYSKEDWHKVQNTLIGVELIHLMALIHDDIMDNSSTRHGVMSMHKYIGKDLLEKNKDDTEEQTSKSLAILVGDIVFSWAYMEFSKDKQTTESWNIIHSLMEEVIIGQMMDVYNNFGIDSNMDEVENKMVLKTANYTFTNPLLLGMVLAGFKKEDGLWVNDFGRSMGLIFQMQDDVFDFTKDTKTLKKNPLGDIKNGTNTLISMHVMQNAKETEKKIWSQWFGNKDLNNQEEIIKFLESVGVWDFTENYIKQKETIALDAVSKSGLKDEDMDKIKKLLSTVTNRKY